MWRMMLIGAVVAAMYVLIGGKITTWQETFGQPWTLDSILSELSRDRVSIELRSIEFRDVPATPPEGFPSLGGPVVVADGTIGGYFGGVLVYATERQREDIWRERGGFEVWRVGENRISDAHAWGAKNLVFLFVDGTAADPSLTSEEVRTELLRFR